MESPIIEDEPGVMAANSPIEAHKNDILKLTKSNHALFLCLNLFFERHKKGSGLKNLTTFSSPTDKACRGMHRHAESFFRLMDSSLKVSSAGISTTKVAISLLSTSGVSIIQAKARLRAHAEECYLDAGKMFEDFRELLRQIMDTYKQAEITVDDYIRHDRPSYISYDVDTLLNTPNVDLPKVLAEIIRRLAEVIMALVTWWEDIRIDSKNVLYHSITGTDAAAFITNWKDLQCRYQVYNKEITVQQDYHKSELQYALPNRGLLSWLRK